MVETIERKPHSRAQERGKIRRKLINRMKNGEVLTVIDFEDLLDMGSSVETLPRFTPQTSIGRYKGETLFFDRTAEHLDFESTVTRIQEKIAS